MSAPFAIIAAAPDGISRASNPLLWRVVHKLVNSAVFWIEVTNY
jgi:hypothetical protein